MTVRLFLVGLVIAVLGLLNGIQWLFGVGAVVFLLAYPVGAMTITRVALRR